MTTMMVVVVGGMGILSVAWLATACLRSASASLRHSIWLAALASILTLPALEVADLQIGVPMPAAMAATLGTGAAVVGDRSGDPATDLRSDLDGGLGHPAGDLRGDVEADRRTDASAARRTALDADLRSDRSDYAGTAPVAGSRTASWAPTTATSLVGDTHPLILVWLAGALVLLVGAASSQLRAALFTSRGVRPAPAPVRRRLERCAGALGVRRPVSLVVSPSIRVPATWGFRRPTVVLPAGYESWSDETLDRVLLHELAHIGRGDCGGFLLGEMARALHWLNPLAWLAVRRLREESERACDDRVLDQAACPSDYAQDLVTLARSIRGGGAAPRAALAMARPSGLSRRVRAILDPACRRDRLRPAAAVVIAAVALGLVLSSTVLTPVASAQPTARELPTSDEVPTPHELPTSHEVPAAADAQPGERPSLTALPDLGEPTLPRRPSSLQTDPVEATPGVRSSSVEDGLQERICVFRPDSRRSMSTHIDEDVIRIRWETDDCRVEIDIYGAIEFSPDDRSVVALASDASFEIEERMGRDVRRARMEGRPDGSIQRRFWVDGDESPWDDEARAWLAGLLPEVFRHSTINAEARVRRMVDQGGAAPVFDEVALIHSDHVSRRYLELLMEVTDLSEDEYRRVIEAAARIDSDHSSAELLMAVVRRAGLRPAFQDGLLAVAEGLESDHQKGEVLALLLDSELSERQLEAVLRSARTIDSDHALGELLSSIARKDGLAGGGRGAFLETLRSIDSDHQQAKVMHAFLDAGTLSEGELTRVLELTRMLDSSHQAAELLQRVAEEYRLSGPRATAYLQAASRIDSDHQKATTAVALLRRGDFDGEQLALVLRIAADVDSDHQRSEILQEVLRTRALTAPEVLELLSVAGGIDSDHQRVRVLLELAEGHDVEGDALARYRALAEDLGRRDRERVLAAIAR